MNKDVLQGNLLSAMKKVNSFKQQIVMLQFPLTINVNGTEFATVICSPTHMEELVVGF